MTVNYSTPILTARMNTVLTQLGTAASLVITDAFNNTLVSIPLANPVGTVAGGVLTFAVPQTAIAGFTGIAVSGTITTSSGGNAITGLTVSSGSGDITLATASIISGQAVTLTIGTITGR